MDRSRTPPPTSAALAELALAYLRRAAGGVPPVEARVVVQLRPGGEHRVWVEYAEAADEPPARPAVTHSPDFRTLDTGGGVTYQFGPTQAAAVRALYEAWERGEPGVGQEAVLEAANSESPRLKDLFAGHHAWGTLVVPVGKGAFRLSLGD